MEGIILLGLATLMTPFMAMLCGYVLSVLWNWFLVPLGIPPIGIAHAYGIALLVSYLTYQYKYDDREVPLEENIKRMVTLFFAALFRAVFVLLAAYLTKLIMG